MTEQAAAGVVCVVVGHEHPLEAHPVVLHEIEELAGRVGWIDGDRHAGCPVADQVGEVDHLSSDRVLAGVVPPREKLAEVEPVVCRSVAHTPALYRQGPLPQERTVAKRTDRGDIRARSAKRQRDLLTHFSRQPFAGEPRGQPGGTF